METTPPAAARPRPAWLSSIATVVGPALLLLAALAGSLAWLLTTTGGLRFAALVASALVPGLTLSGLDGALNSDIRIRTFELAGAGWSVRIDDVALSPDQLSWPDRRISLEQLTARSARIDWVPSGRSDEPTSLALPFELVVRNANVQELALGARAAEPTVFRRIGFAGRMDPQGIELKRLAGEMGRTRIDAQLRVDAQPPFAAVGHAHLATSFQGRSIVANLTASGSLRELQLDMDADDAAARARARATLALFARVPIVRLRADVDAFDPALWFDGVPSMQLQGQADLAPASAGSWSVSGPFHVENRTAGPLDLNRLPLRLLRGTLLWSADELNLAIDRADGIRGTATGRLTWSAATESLAAQVQFERVDAASLYSRAVATNLAGRLDYTLRAGEQRFRGSLRNASGPPLTADLDATIRDRVLEVAAAHLRLGNGRADLTGRLEFDGERSARVQGSFKDLDLAQLVRGIDTHLNGTLELDSRLREPLAGRARFALEDSRIAGRPVIGGGTLALADRQLEADVDLRSGGARLTAVGAIGSGRELQIELSVPDLQELLPRHGGRIEARTTVAGAIDRARINGMVSLVKLRAPDGQRIESAMASFSGGLAADAPLAVTMTLSGHVHPAGQDRSIAGAKLVARGTTGDATIELTGATGTRQPLRALLSGGIRDGAWRGSLNAVEVGAPLDLLMRTPAPLQVSSTGLSLGPADFLLRGAHFSAVELARADGRWRTAGSFEGMQPQALDAQARAPRRVVRSGAGDRVPLTLAGRWSLEYTDAVSGIAVIERTGGDLYSGIDALNPIGVSDVGAALNVLDNRLTGNIYMRGRALGKIDALVDAYVDPALTGGRLLAQDRPLRVVIDATLPDLSWIGPLIGDNVQFGGQASINATIGGTPADPTSTGTLRGDALRLAWVDQAVRLENGRLDAVLDDGVVVINELRFAGTPRVSPLDTRALEGLVSERPFEVRAVGRLALRSLTGSIGINATQLPVLQRADRWMVVSGNGGITLSPQRADLYASLTVDGAYVNFDGLRAGRNLPGDVVVKRPGEQRKPTAEAPVEVRLDLKGNLGPRFYVQGAGLEARLAGEVNVTGRASQLRADGVVRTVDGVYAGYGQRLRIERGIVTFLGPIDNPALNVLAVRSGLPVEVGVAIGGTAQRPIVRLHSDPSMSETEKLNWLVLGRPAGASGDGNDRAILSAAATALFSGQVDSASAGLMRSLGIDQITLQPGQSSASLLPRETVAGRLRSGGVSTSNTAAADFVAVGKRINDDLYLSFEQALSGAEYFVALNYRLTRQLSLIARAGSTNALDLVYSIAFD